MKLKSYFPGGVSGGWAVPEHNCSHILKEKGGLKMSNRYLYLYINFKHDSADEVFVSSKEPNGGVDNFNRGKGLKDTPYEKYVTICEKMSDVNPSKHITYGQSSYMVREDNY